MIKETNVFIPITIAITGYLTIKYFAMKTKGSVRGEK